MRDNTVHEPKIIFEVTLDTQDVGEAIRSRLLGALGKTVRKQFTAAIKGDNRSTIQRARDLADTPYRRAFHEARQRSQDIQLGGHWSFFGGRPVFVKADNAGGFSKSPSSITPNPTRTFPSGPSLDEFAPQIPENSGVYHSYVGRFSDRLQKTRVPLKTLKKQAREIASDPTTPTDVRKRGQLAATRAAAISSPPTTTKTDADRNWESRLGAFEGPSRTEKKEPFKPDFFLNKPEKLIQDPKFHATIYKEVQLRVRPEILNFSRTPGEFGHHNVNTAVDEIAKMYTLDPKLVREAYNRATSNMASVRKVFEDNNEPLARRLLTDEEQWQYLLTEEGDVVQRIGESDDDFERRMDRQLASTNRTLENIDYHDPTTRHGGTTPAQAQEMLEAFEQDIVLKSHSSGLSLDDEIKWTPRKRVLSALAMHAMTKEGLPRYKASTAVAAILGGRTDASLIRKGQKTLGTRTEPVRGRAVDYRVAGVDHEKNFQDRVLGNRERMRAIFEGREGTPEQQAFLQSAMAELGYDSTVFDEPTTQRTFTNPHEQHAWEKSVRRLHVSKLRSVAKKDLIDVLSVPDVPFDEKSPAPPKGPHPRTAPIPHELKLDAFRETIGQKIPSNWRTAPAGKVKEAYTTQKRIVTLGSQRMEPVDIRHAQAIGAQLAKDQKILVTNADDGGLAFASGAIANGGVVEIHAHNEATRLQFVRDLQSKLGPRSGWQARIKFFVLGDDVLGKPDEDFNLFMDVVGGDEKLQKMTPNERLARTNIAKALRSNPNSPVFLYSRPNETQRQEGRTFSAFQEGKKTGRTVWNIRKDREGPKTENLVTPPAGPRISGSAAATSGEVEKMFADGTVGSILEDRVTPDVTPEDVLPEPVDSATPTPQTGEAANNFVGSIAPISSPPPKGEVNPNTTLRAQVADLDPDVDPTSLTSGERIGHIQNLALRGIKNHEDAKRIGRVFLSEVRSTPEFKAQESTLRNDVQKLSAQYDEALGSVKRLFGGATVAEVAQIKEELNTKRRELSRIRTEALQNTLRNIRRMGLPSEGLNTLWNSTEAAPESVGLDAARVAGLTSKMEKAADMLPMTWIQRLNSARQAIAIAYDPSGTRNDSVFVGNHPVTGVPTIEIHPNLEDNIAAFIHELIHAIEWEDREFGNQGYKFRDATDASEIGNVYASRTDYRGIPEIGMHSEVISVGVEAIMSGGTVFDSNFDIYEYPEYLEFITGMLAGYR